MQPRIHSTTSILPVADIPATLAYYREVLGAEECWNWDSHGGCRLGSVWIHFSLDPVLCAQAKGLSLFLNVLEIDLLCKRQREAGAHIVDELKPRPWGALEYVVEDCNGFRLRFTQGGFTSERRDPLKGVNIVERRLTADECRALFTGVGWHFDDRSEELAKTINDPAVTFVAQFGGQCIGAASILAHDCGHYLVFNVIVLPEYQSQGVGKQLMSALDAWLTKNGKPGALVKLFTGLDRQPFYQQFGFKGPESGLVGMTKTIS